MSAVAPEGFGAAYVPGQTARPREGAFDALKQVSVPLRDSPAWHAGWRFFHAGYFWEAHEVWEAVWMAAPEKSPEKVLVQGVIQRANARLKSRMGQERAAERLDAMADRLIAEAMRRGGAGLMGIDENLVL